nr:hypothetical protein [Prevotella sp.]
MEEIKVYSSIRRNISLILVCLVFVALALFLLHEGKSQFIAWMCILFFGGGALTFIFLSLKQKLTGKPFLVITDKSVTMSSTKEWVVNFADVESFTIIDHAQSKLIGIKYKKDVEFQKLDETSAIGRAIRKMNINLADCQEAIPANGLTMQT